MVVVVEDIGPFNEQLKSSELRRVSVAWAEDSVMVSEGRGQVDKTFGTVRAAVLDPLVEDR